jgi:hypothetical protein
MDEALAEQQRAAYKMPGVDDDEPAVDPSKKRKAVEAENVCCNFSHPSTDSSFWLLN